jgi:hypothetical protein
MKQRTLSLLVVLSFAGVAYAQQRDLSGYSRVLLPFHESVRTADGWWNVNWWIRNDGDVAVDVYPVAYSGGLPPPPEFRDFVFLARYPAASPRSTLKTIAGDVSSAPFIPAFVPLRTKGVGAFIHVETVAGSTLAVSGTIAFRSQELQPAPTPLRAIPERAFLEGRHSIVAVPEVPNARYDLRVYALQESVGMTGVTIRVYDTQATIRSTEDLLVSTQTADLRSPATSLAPCYIPCDAPAADLAPATLEVFNLIGPQPEPWFPHTYRIEIEPDSPDVRWWAVLSTMDTATRHVTVYQPSF